MHEAGELPPPDEGTLPASVELQTVVGPLLFPAGDAVMARLIGERGYWEPAESAVMTALLAPGARVLDVGAHVGYMTALACARVGLRATSSPSRPTLTTTGCWARTSPAWGSRRHTRSTPPRGGRRAGG